VGEWVQYVPADADGENHHLYAPPPEEGWATSPQKERPPALSGKVESEEYAPSLITLIIRKLGRKS
jgi:hypothetical protein